jgi:hypothetical protein
MLPSPYITKFHEAMLLTCFSDLYILGSIYINQETWTINVHKHFFKYPPNSLTDFIQKKGEGGRHFLLPIQSHLKVTFCTTEMKHNFPSPKPQATYIHLQLPS